MYNFKAGCTLSYSIGCSANFRLFQKKKKKKRVKKERKKDSFVFIQAVISRSRLQRE